MTKISDTVIKVYHRLKLDDKLDFSNIENSIDRLDVIGNDLQGEIEKLGYDPNHRVYTDYQNLLSIFEEEITVHRDFKFYNKQVLNFHKNYMPSFPPMSPVTNAYFAYWVLCDFQFGKNKETINTIFSDVGEVEDFEEMIFKVGENLHQSHMKFYRHMGFQDDLIILKDIISDEVYYCKSNSGYEGKKDEIWFIRIVPNLDKVHDYHLVITTPYIILRNSVADWVAFFKRQGIEKGDPKMEIKYRDFMKNSPSSNYWLEYLLDGYVNFQPHSIELTGIPDVSGSKPHEMDKL